MVDKKFIKEVQYLEDKQFPLVGTYRKPEPFKSMEEALKALNEGGSVLPRQ
jgi:hypothetical protein